MESQSYEYHCVKDHEEEGGGNVGEPGDHDRVGICDQFFSTWFSMPPLVPDNDLKVV